MAKDILDVLLNPIRMRILQLFTPAEPDTPAQMTANGICELLSDIPRTTLYRHINVLIEAGVVDVASERKVRGSVERTLALNMTELEKLQGNNVENVPQLAFRYLMTIYAKFEKYFRTHERIEDGDSMFFMSNILMLNDQELKDYLTELGQVDAKYSKNKSTDEGRRPREFALILAPPDDIKSEENLQKGVAAID